MYRIDILAFVIISVLQIFATNLEQLFILRLLLGIAIGADYPIATSLVAEFAPKKYRGQMMGFLAVSWYIGAVAAYLVGYFMLDMGENAWRWMLGSSAIPSIILLFMRMNTPESPRWLMSKGKTDKALAIMKRVYGKSVTLEDIPMVEESKTKFTKIFEPDYIKRTVFASLFPICFVAPFFAISTFSPQILESFNLNEGKMAHIGAAVISLVFLIGKVLAAFLVNRMGRRPLNIWRFFFMTIAMFGIGLFPDSSIWLIGSFFCMYAIFSGAPSLLQWLYPNELFPTDIRATGVGFTTAISRIGAFVGTFLLPISLESLGIGPTMLIAAVISLMGLIICIAWAPETTNQPLSEASGVGVQDENTQLSSRKSMNV